jgi:UDPglucose 6-dehydrogenase
MAETTQVAIVGMGHVGKNMAKLFPEAVCYDKAVQGATREEVNRARIAIVCTSTPSAVDGSADVESVEEVVGWLESELIVIRSTVPPGTTDRLRESTGKRIVVAPEYVGEWTYPTPWDSPSAWPFIIVGGLPADTSEVVTFFASVLGPMRTYRQTSARLAELCKYMENAWLAMQVSFANEFWRIAVAHDVDYWELRELWALDPRVSKTHTMVNPSSPGFGGRCLPKDAKAIIMSSRAHGYDAELLAGMIEFNEKLRATSGGAMTEGEPRPE